MHVTLVFHIINFKETSTVKLKYAKSTKPIFQTSNLVNANLDKIFLHNQPIVQTNCDIPYLINFFELAIMGSKNSSLSNLKSSLNQFIDKNSSRKESRTGPSPMKHDRDSSASISHF